MRERNGYYWDVLAWRNSRKVRAMSPETRAIYREVMDEIWINGGVPNDVEQISVLTGWSLELTIKAWPQIHDCLIPTRKNPDLFTSERLEQERAKRNKIRKARKKFGQLGGKITQAKKRESREAADVSVDNEQAIASDLLKQNSSQAQAIQVTSTSNKEHMANSAKSSRRAYTQEFEEFWESSSKRGSKWAAFLVWKAIAAEIRPDVFTAMAVAVQQWRGTEERYIPHVVRWLKEKRWEVTPMTRAATANTGFRPVV